MNSFKLSGHDSYSKYIVMINKLYVGDLFKQFGYLSLEIIYNQKNASPCTSGCYAVDYASLNITGKVPTILLPFKVWQFLLWPMVLCAKLKNVFEYIVQLGNL